jgi:RNA polymerase sigma-70 factor (ECF subfamily)
VEAGVSSGSLVGADFDVVFRDEYPRLLRIVYALCGSRSVAEDAAQEALLRAYDDWSRVSAMDRPRAWIRQVAINLARSRLRRVAAEARAVARSAMPRTESDLAELPEDADRFWAAVRRLPRRQAEAIALHYADDLAIADVAVVMRVAEGTVKAHLHGARQKLGEWYEREESTS